MSTYRIITARQAFRERIQNLMQLFSEWQEVEALHPYPPPVDLGFIDMDFELTEEVAFYKVLGYKVGISKHKENAYGAFQGNYFYFLLESEVSALSLKDKILTPLAGQIAAPKFILLRSNREFTYVPLSNILYLKADGNTTDFYMVDQQVIHGYQKIKSYAKRLPATFVRVHRSYVIHTEYLIRMNLTQGRLWIKGASTVIPFTAKYKAAVEQVYMLLSKESC